MDTVTSKNAIFKSRSLTGRISASFKFVGDHLKYLLKISAWFLVPIACIQAVIITFFNGMEESPSALFVSSVSWGLVLAGIILFSALIYTLLQQYAQLGYLPGAGLKKLLRPLRINFIRLIWIGLLYVAVGVILSFLLVAGVWYISWFTLFITLPLSIFVFILLLYVPYVYIFEPVGFREAVMKSFRIGLLSWGSTFAVIILMAILTGIIQVVASLPAGTAVLVRNFAEKALTGTTDRSVLPQFFQALLFILSFFSVFVSAFSQILSMAAMAFQYGSVITSECEKKKLESQIQNL